MNEQLRQLGALIENIDENQQSDAPVRLMITMIKLTAKMLVKVAELRGADKDARIELLSKVLANIDKIASKTGENNDAIRILRAMHALAIASVESEALQ